MIIMIAQTTGVSAISLPSKKKKKDEKKEKRHPISTPPPPQKRCMKVPYFTILSMSPTSVSLPPAHATAQRRSARASCRTVYEHHRLLASQTVSLLSAGEDDQEEGKERTEEGDIPLELEMIPERLHFWTRDDTETTTPPR